jgi:hypothetical protein
MAPREGPKADIRLFCAPIISSNFHRHFFVAPRVGPKAEVLVAVELLSIQAESQAQSLLALQPSDRKENTYLLLLGHHNLRP